MTTCSCRTVVDDDVASSSITTLNNTGVHNRTRKATEATTAAWEWHHINRSAVIRGMSVRTAANVDADLAAAAGTGERHWIVVYAEAIIWSAGDTVDRRVRVAAVAARRNKAMNKRAVNSRRDLRLVVGGLVGHAWDQGEVVLSPGSRPVEVRALINQGGQTLLCVDSAWSDVLSEVCAVRRSKTGEGCLWFVVVGAVQRLRSGGICLCLWCGGCQAV